MPGRELSPRTDLRPLETRSGKMGVYKLDFEGEMATTAPRTKPSPLRPGRRFVIPSYTTSRVQPMAKYCTSPVAECLEVESFPVAAGAGDMISEDDATDSVFTASTRTSNSNVTISDDDMSFMADDYAMTRPAEFAPARHSTACCTDLALRRELRRVKFHADPLDELPTPGAMGHSFRRDLEKEDRVESLALWEEDTSELASVPSSRDRSLSKDHHPHHPLQQVPFSWHAPDAVTASKSYRNKALESLFRKPKKAFFHNLFSGLPSFSSSRRSKKT